MITIVSVFQWREGLDAMVDKTILKVIMTTILDE